MYALERIINIFMILDINWPVESFYELFFHMYLSVNLAFQKHLRIFSVKILFGSKNFHWHINLL